MDRNLIIKKINDNKKQPNLRYRLKRKVESFTDLLFLTLFDIETPVEDNLHLLEKQFDELVDLACWDVEKSCSAVWDNYTERLPVVLEKLNLDADAIASCDPASLSPSVRASRECRRLPTGKAPQRSPSPAP